MEERLGDEDKDVLESAILAVSQCINQITPNLRLFHKLLEIVRSEKKMSLRESASKVISNLFKNPIIQEESIVFCFHLMFVSELLQTINKNILSAFSTIQHPLFRQLPSPIQNTTQVKKKKKATNIHISFFFFVLV